MRRGWLLAGTLALSAGASVVAVATWTRGAYPMPDVEVVVDGDEIAQAAASPDDAFSVETFPAQVSATLGSSTILQPRRVRGGTAPFKRSLSGGDGVSLGALGTVIVAPRKEGSYGPFTLTVTDARGRTASTEMHVVASEPLSLSGNPPPSGTVGKAYEARFVAKGGRPPYAWSFSGLSPAGLAFVNGTLSGVPQQAGEASGMVVTATDADNRQAYSGLFSVSVSDSLALQKLPGRIEVVVGQPRTLPAPAVTGGEPPYRKVLSGGEGATLNQDGSITVAPRAAGKFGPFELSVVDGRGRTGVTRMAVEAVDELKPPPAQDVALAHGMETYLPGTAPDGGVAPYVFSLVSDASGEVVDPPRGLAFAADGSIFGIPGQAGIWGAYRVRLTDGGGRKAESLPFRISVAVAPEAGRTTPREVYVDGRRYCSSSRGDDCARAGDFETVEVRYPTLQKVNEITFGCEFASVPGGVWEISDGTRWTLVSPTWSMPCSASIPTTAVRAVRYTRADGRFTRMWAPRAQFMR